MRDAGCECCCCLDADLLSEHRAHRHLEGVPRAGDPKAGARPHTGAQGWMRAEMLAGSAPRSKSRRTRSTTRSRCRWSGMSRRRSKEVSESCATSRTPGVPAIVMVRRYLGPSVVSTPPVARAPRKVVSASQSKGGRNDDRMTNGLDEYSWFERRSWVGASPNVRRTSRLNCRMLLKPAANATWETGNDVSSSSWRAKCTRRLRAIASGPAPRCVSKIRRRCREPTASRAAKPSTLPSSSAPSSIRCSARDTISDPAGHPGSPADLSGRQRLQGRKPPSSAAAEHAKKRTFCRLGGRTGQTGLQ